MTLDASPVSSDTAAPMAVSAVVAPADLPPDEAVACASLVL